MHKLTFYPLGNADCCLVELNSGKLILFDYANVRDPDDDTDLRIDLDASIRNKLEELGKTNIEIVVFTHADNDHIKKASEIFYLEHAEKYKTEDRIVIDELWVPSAMITETGLQDDAAILRSEARYRLKNKKGIKVFSRPESLKEWLASENLSIDDFNEFLVDAGRNVPGITFQNDGFEVFVHSPFARRQDDGTLVERNECSIVVQLSLQSEALVTNVLMSADTTWEAWEEIIDITDYHENNDKLHYDVFKLPHHCSYLSLSSEIGDDVTKPTEKINNMFKSGKKGGIIVSTSKPIPDDNDSTQPPHRQAANYYKNIINEFDGEFKVTMEHPSKDHPEPLCILIDETGVTLKKSFSGITPLIGSKSAPRAGKR